jgi:rhomboid protease GluP
VVLLRFHESEDKINEWALVLSSSYIPYEINEEKDKWKLYVDSSYIKWAERVLQDYERENQTLLLETSETRSPGRSFSGLVVSLLIIVIFILMKLTETDRFLFQIGSASASRIMSGELWRILTALCLHADLIHVLSNSFSCWVFCTAVIQLYGFGFGWLLILAGGASGNLFTALVYQTGHISIGASTAIFGALGLLGAWRCAFGKKYKLLKKRTWIYVAGVLALIAVLGTGKNVDLLAHLMGVVSGVIFGFLGARKMRAPALDVAPTFQLTMAAASAVCVILSWICALYLS